MRARRREEDLGGEARRPFEHVGRNQDGSPGAVYKEARCATLNEEDDRGEQRDAHRGPRTSGSFRILPAWAVS